MKDRAICIHGHFYQPERENPWLLEVERQPSASPYHDWNERVVAEAYATNTAARVLDPDGWIIDIRNNFASISFDAGPTILAWLERHRPEVYEAIRAADSLSQARFSGHGSAIAQAYSHMILPLANARDKRTQVRWGIADFEHRFGRRPEGMWLPETAVDIETLEILADRGIAFTILAPRQACRVRPLEGDAEWIDVADGSIDTTMPYRCRLPSGRSIALFFYAPVATEVAFGTLLENGDRFRERLMAAFLTDEDRPQIAHIATDGETYGHHRRFGEMALAYCLRTIEERDDAEITVYGEYLERHPPTHEAEIRECTSWSCEHGVDRWRCDCGCRFDGRAGASQAWRGPLRDAMDWLRDHCAEIFEHDMRRIVRDPWEARDDFIRVLLDRSPAAVDRFFADHASKPLGAHETVRALVLLEMQRQAMLMYTSCGWFFDDIAGIEAVQVMRHAARAMQLLRDLGYPDLERGFMQILAPAESAAKEYGNGAGVYERLVRPAVIALPRVGLHRILASFFDDSGPRPVDGDLFPLVWDARDVLDADRGRLLVGTFGIRSTVTGESRACTCAVLHDGADRLMAGVRPSAETASFERVKRALLDAVADGDTAGALVLLEQIFGARLLSMADLSDAEQVSFSAGGLRTMETELERMAVWFSPLVETMVRGGVAAPGSWKTIRATRVSSEIVRLLGDEGGATDALRSLVGAAVQEQLDLDLPRIGTAAGRRIRGLLEAAARDPADAAYLRTIEEIAANLTPLPLVLDLWASQNAYFAIAAAHYPDRAQRAEAGDAGALDWVTRFRRIGAMLRVRTP